MPMFLLTTLTEPVTHPTLVIALMEAIHQMEALTVLMEATELVLPVLPVILELLVLAKILKIKYVIAWILLELVHQLHHCVPTKLNTISEDRNTVKISMDNNNIF